MRIGKENLESKLSAFSLRHEAILEDEKSVLEKIDEVIIDGGKADQLSSNLMALQSEADAVYRAMKALEVKVSEAEAFEKSDQAKALRKDLKALDADRKKLDAEIVKKAKSLCDDFRAFHTLLKRYDRISKDLGEGVESYGYVSIRRNSRNVWLDQLHASLDKWLDHEKWLGNK